MSKPEIDGSLSMAKTSLPKTIDALEIATMASAMRHVSSPAPMATGIIRANETPPASNNISLILCCQFIAP